MKALLRAVIVLVVLCVSGFLALAYWARPPQAGPAGDAAVTRAAGEAGSQPDALGQFSPLAQPRPAPGLTILGRDGRPVALADFRGRWLLVNLWATWCGPCVREMPSLDRLQAQLGKRLTVLAISEDRSGAQVVDPFLDKLGLGNLQIYLDPKAEAQQAFAVRGLPTSFLVDREGRILGQLEGAAQWDDPAMVARLERYLQQDEAVGPLLKTSASR